MTFSDIKIQVNEKCDGRTFSEDKQARWANTLRRDIAMDFVTSGIYGLFFLYKEATVQNGSVKDEPKYAVPDDFIDDLNVFYDNNLLLKPPPRMLDITQDLTTSGTPQWVILEGVEFRIVQAPEEAGKEIKLLYNALADNIPSSSNDSFSDYFLTHFPSLHVFGIGEMAAASKGMNKIVSYCNGKFEAERTRLMLHNRRHYLKNGHPRFQNWDEYQEKKRLVFPQFQES